MHHDLWDYDVAAPPGPDHIRGKPALAVGSKTGNLFILDRLTGKPVFGVEERPVPEERRARRRSLAHAALSPAARAPRGRRVEPWGPTPEEKAWCTEAISQLRYDGIFTPPSLKGSLLFPGNIGGLAWGGVAFDPKSGTLIVPYNRLPAVARLVPRADLADAEKATAGLGDGAPGRHALRHAAQLPAEPEGHALHRAALRPPGGNRCRYRPRKVEGADGFQPLYGFERMGVARALGGPVATAGGLIFLGATFEAGLKAYETATGKLVWTGALPTSARATPMTFLGADGKQYVVIAAGGHDVPGGVLSDTLVAFAIP